MAVQTKQEESLIQYFQAKQLRVVLDLDSIPTAPDDLGDQLLGLLKLGDFELLRYSDGGPPAGEVEHFEQMQADYAKGWLILDVDEAPTFDHAAVGSYALANGGVSKFYVGGGDPIDVPLHFIVEAGEDPLASRDQVRRDLILQHACEEMGGGPILITERQSLIRPIPGLPDWKVRIPVLRVAEAIVIVGLLLRARGKYIARTDGRYTFQTSRSGFHSIVAGELVPARWPCLSALMTAKPDDYSRISGLLLAQHERLASALKVRDTAWSSGLVMSESDAEDERLGSVIDVAWNLMGAFDVTAKAIELLSPTGTGLQNAKWQNSQWRAQQRTNLPDVIIAASRHVAIFDVVRTLRNTVHSELMHIVIVRGGRTRGVENGSHLALPPDDSDTLRRALQSSGGFDRWSVQELTNGQLIADPLGLIDRMIRKAALALNDIFAAIPLEQLLGVNCADLSSDPPWSKSIPEEWRMSMRLQTGLADQTAG